MRAIAIGILLFAACSSSSGPEPEYRGEGTLEVIPIPSDWPVIEFHVSPDERFVVARAGTRDGDALVLGPDLKVVNQVPNRGWRALGIEADGQSAFVVQERTVEFWALPGLHMTGEIADPRGSRAPAARAVNRIPGEASWAITSRDEVRRVDLNPPAYGATGRTAINQPIGCAVDPKTGRLIVIGDGKEMEVFDSKTMQFVGRLSLPCTGLSPEAAAVGGFAYVATHDGTVLSVDLSTLEVGESKLISSQGAAHLALSGRGNVLAVGSRARDGTNAVLRVYRVADGKLKRIDGASTKVNTPLSDLAVIESTNTVLLAGRISYAWRYKG